MNLTLEEHGPCEASFKNLVSVLVSDLSFIKYFNKFRQFQQFQFKGFSFSVYKHVVIFDYVYIQYAKNTEYEDTRLNEC